MRKSIIVIFSYALFSFAICLGFSSFAGHLPILLPEHKSAFVFYRGLSYFFRFLPAILCSGYLIALAIQFGEDSEKAQIRFSRVIMRHFRHVMIVSVVLVAILTFVAEIISPMTQRRKTYLQEVPHLLTEYIRLGKQCLDEENYVLAHRYGTQILRIKSNSVEGKELIDKSEAILKAIKKITPQTVKTTKQLYTYKEAGNETVTSLIKKAKAASDKGSWFEAHYYAWLAASTGTEKDINIKEARRLASVAWNHLLDAPVTLKTKDQILFAKKRAAYKALSEGDYVDAYYQFLEIAAEDITWSSDPDVTQFLEIAKSRVEAQCFFIDETEKLQTFENYLNVYFSIKHDSGLTDVVYIRGITPISDGGRMIQYLRGLTVTTYDKNGSFLKSFSVPYAKMLSVDATSFDEETIEKLEIKKSFKRVPYLMLESIDRNLRGKRIIPHYEFSDSVKERDRRISNFAVLAISMDDFNTGCDASVGIDRMNLNALMKTSGKAVSLGYSAEVSGDELIKRICYPFIMLMIFVFLASVAWNFRINEGQLFKFIWIVVVPVCTVVSDIFIQIILTIGGLFNYVLICVAGNSALLIALLIWIALLVVAAVFFACRKTV